MNSNRIQQSYRQSSIEGASPIGLVIALYDALAADLRRATDALRRDDIETRCAELHHAALILGQLEDWIDHKEGGDLAESLTAFYGYLRAKMLQASLQKSATLLEDQIELILGVRTAWHQLDTTPKAVPDEVRILTESEAYQPSSGVPQHVVFSQSA
ncbi:MAG: flagellar export chaperone FliS [Acidobacteriota bacterium]